jgi:hypothetical protein
MKLSDKKSIQQIVLTLAGLGLKDLSFLRAHAMHLLLFHSINIRNLNALVSAMKEARLSLL